MREITSHRSNELNEALKITAMDEPGHGGANHVYAIHADESIGTLKDGKTVYQMLKFQNGPVSEAGINGGSNESLLAVLIDRVEGFQRGLFPCTLNDEALKHLKAAMSCFHARTADRVMRCVEGTSTP